MELAEAVRSFSTYNFRGAKIPVPSSFQITHWDRYLEHYHDRAVVDFLKYGWPINYNSPIIPTSTSRNHPSANTPAITSFLSDYIRKELDHNAITGPFSGNPFSVTCMISPLQCVPKHNSTEPRVVHDLSFPKFAAVNDGIDKDEYLSQPFSLRLPGIDRLVEFVNAKGPGCLVFKKDLKRAYRQIPVDPHDYHLLGLTVANDFYFHTRLPFGLRSATMACQRTTKAVAHILHELGLSIDVYIDDFYGAETPELAEASFLRMSHLFNELGLLASPDKDTPPTHEMICLGIQINTRDMTLTVPDFRLRELLDLLLAWTSKESFTKCELQQLLGKLAFVTACVRPGRAFSCRLINSLKYCHAHPTQQSFSISNPLRADIHWWTFFLQHFNGICVIPQNVTISNPELFACDACLSACGAVCFGEFFHHEFPKVIADQHLHINQLELLTIVVTVKLWHVSLKGLSVELLTDNSSCVYAINSRRSSDLFMQRCLRELWLCLALNNIHLTARHISTHANTLADALSRFHLSAECAEYVCTTTTELQLTGVSLEDSIFTFRVT